MSILRYLKNQLFLLKGDIKFQKLKSCSNGVFLSDKCLFQWKEVVSIEAYKRDLVTEDLICLEIKLSSHESITLHEELKGFEEFKAIMSSQLKVNNTNWMSAVMLPPFEECRTLVYKVT